MTKKISFDVIKNGFTIEKNVSSVDFNPDVGYIVHRDGIEETDRIYYLNNLRILFDNNAFRITHWINNFDYLYVKGPGFLIARGEVVRQKTFSVMDGVSYTVGPDNQLKRN